MGFFSRFFGRSDDDSGDGGDPPPAKPGSPLVGREVENGATLQVLCLEPWACDPGALAEALRGLSPSLRGARAESEMAGETAFLALAGWGPHAVRLVGFGSPMPDGPVEVCLRPAHFDEPRKERMRDHAGHILLYYAGLHEDIHEQYVACAAVAAALTRLGAAVGVLNEHARAATVAEVFDGEAIKDGQDFIELLRTLPLLFLYIGFVKYDVEGVEGVWMRTHGAGLYGVPEFAARAAGHGEGSRFFELFNNIYSYLRESGAHLAAGHTMQVGADEFLRVREPGDGEPFFAGEENLLVAEVISAAEINRPR